MGLNEVDAQWCIVGAKFKGGSYSQAGKVWLFIAKIWVGHVVAINVGPAIKTIFNHQVEFVWGEVITQQITCIACGIKVT